ncbi:MAG TPA: BTAD domain-containing putative transcriptional regulator [Pilimelia sp.]|nr:BTAD domain-containing putative transcriptional regulator [Pilimelia sp.]
MELRLLGPVQAWTRGEQVRLGSRRERLVLAILALEANHLVPVERLIDLSWPDGPPRSARACIQTDVHRLRAVLGTIGAGEYGVRVASEKPGYVLRMDPMRIDAHRFIALVDRARAAADDAARTALLDEALGLWRGPALAGAADGETRVRLCNRLDEVRAVAVEDRIDARLRLGEHNDVLGELADLVQRYPLRERLAALLMRAQQRGGRPADALRTYQEIRRRLADELGLDPGTELQRLHQEVLRGDAAAQGDAAAATDDAGANAHGDAAAHVDAAVRVDAAAVPAPAQLPPDVSGFAGRAEHVRQLDALLGTDRQAAAVPVTVIAGTAGVGKTALAVHWGHRVVDRFPDGQLYVDLRGFTSTAPRRPIDVLALFLRALGVDPHRVPVDLAEATALFRSLLAGRRMLVLLDNAATPEQVRPLLPGAAGCFVLITSRDRLGGLVALEGAHPFVLDVLAPGEAVSLLEAAIGPSRAAAGPGAVAELARACAYLPLALRIAAANLGARAWQSVEAYVTELTGTGNRLAALQADDDPRAAVRNAFHASYAALPIEAATVFRRLGLVPGPDVTAPAAAALADTTVGQAQRALDRLARAHLVDQRIPGRYGCHDLLRRYAQECAAVEDGDDGCAAALDRLLAWYLDRADAAARLLYPDKLRLPVPSRRGRPARPSDAAAGTPQPLFRTGGDAVTWLEEERPNLISAVTHAAEHGPYPPAILLADTLRGFLWLRRHTVDWLAVAQAGRVAAEKADDLRGQAAARLSNALAQASVARSAHALAEYAASLDLARASGWQEAQEAILGNVGIVHYDLGQLDLAADQLRAALAINKHTGRQATQANTLLNLGCVCYELGRLDEAHDHLSHALVLCRESLGSQAHGSALNNLALVCWLRGELDAALGHLTEALRIGEDIGLCNLQVDALASLADVHRTARHRTRALDHARWALALAQKIDHPRGEADAHNALAAAQLCLGRHEAAIDGHARALDIARRIGARHPQAVALTGLATAHRPRGRDYAHEALAVARQAGFRIVEADALTVLADIELTGGDADGAVGLAHRALAAHRETGHRVGAARTLVILSRALERQARADQARSCRDEAQAIFTEVGIH